MADVNGTDHLVRHEKDNVGNGGYDNEGFHPCDRKGEEEESASDDDRLRVVVTENGHRTEGDVPLPNGHAREESISQSVNGTAVVVLGEEEENDEEGSYKRFGIGECQSNMDSAQKPLDTRLHHYVAVDDVDRNILSNSDNTHVSIPEDAVISFSTGRVRVKNRTSSSPQAPRESIPLETIPTSYDVEDKAGIGLEKKAELEAELSNHKNGVWAETHIYSGAEGLYTSDKLNGTSKSSDEVSLPVNNHRKCLSREGSSSSSSEIKSTGEKLYFTEENRKLCPGWRRLILCGLILIIIAVAVCLGVLAATGILLAESDSKNIRHESSHQLPSMDSISHAGFPYRRPSSNVPQKFQPSVTTEVEFLPNTTSKTTNSVLDTVSPATPQVSSKVPVLNDATHSQTIVPNALVGEFTIIDENFTDDLNDNTSQGFLNLANNLELDLRRIFRENSVNFEKLQILNFRPGSIKVKFVVIWIPNNKVISASKASEILAADLAKKNNSFFNLFHVDINTIHFMDVFDECRIQKGGCTFDCTWNYDTLAKTCICPINNYLLSDGKSCGTEKESSIATTEIVDFQTTTPLSTETISPTLLSITTIMEKKQTATSMQSTTESLLTTTQYPLLVEETTITKLSTKSMSTNEETTTGAPQTEHTLSSTALHQETTTDKYETNSYITITENETNEHTTIKEDITTEYEHSTTTNSDVTSEKLFLPTTMPEILQTLKENFSDKGNIEGDKISTTPLSETTVQPQETEATTIYDTEITTLLINNYSNNNESMKTKVPELHSEMAQTTVSTFTNIYSTKPGVTEQPMESTTFNSLYKDTEEDKTTIKFHLIETPTELYTIKTEFDYSTTLTEGTTLSTTLSNDQLTTTILPETNINSFKEIEATTQNNTATTFGYTDQPVFTKVSTNVTAYPNTGTEKSFTDLEFTTIKPETDIDTTKFTEKMAETEEKSTAYVTNYPNTNFITTQSPTINPITNPSTLPQSSPQPQSNKTPGVRSFDNFTHEPTITTPNYTYAEINFNETTEVPHNITSFSDNQSSLSPQNSTKKETAYASTTPSTNIYDLNQLATAAVAENSTSYPEIESTTVAYIENRTGINNAVTKPYDTNDRNTTLHTEHSAYTETDVTEKFQDNYNATDTISLNKTDTIAVPDTDVTTAVSYTTLSAVLNKQETTETIVPGTEVEDIFKEVTTTMFESETIIPSTTELKTTLKELLGDATQYTTASNIDITTFKSDNSHLTSPSPSTKIVQINETMSTTSIYDTNTDNLKVFEYNNTETTTVSHFDETITTTELPETVINTEKTVTPFKEITTPAFIKEITTVVTDTTTINPLISETETDKPIKNDVVLTTIPHLEVTTQKNSYATNENYDTTLKYPPGTFLTTTVLPTTNILFNTEDENSQSVMVTKSQISTATSEDITGNNDYRTEAVTKTAIPVTKSYQKGKTNSTEKTTEMLNNTNMLDVETTTSTILHETTTEFTLPGKTTFVTQPTFENAATTEIHMETDNTEVISDSNITTINAEAGTTMSLQDETETLLTLPINKESFTTEPTNVKLSETTTYHTEVILPTTNILDNETLMAENISNVTLYNYATTISILEENTNATEVPHDLGTLGTLNINATTDIIGETTAEVNKPEFSTEENKFSLNFNASDETMLQEASSNVTNGYDEVINEATTNANIGIECRDDQFICEPLNICLNNTFMCDGIPDCPDGTDEFDCQDSCHTNFMCINSSTCIMSEARCDGIWDCDNGTDEEFCTPTECAKHEVMCSDGSKCIKPVDICDWKYDCEDRSDEVGCVERTTCESNGKFFCNDGLCIPWSLKCDGEFDCKDKEDEGNCTCLNGEFQCNDGKCLKSSSRCDGHRDCHDGDDEMGCVNVDSQHMVMTFEPYSSTWALLCAEDFNLDDGHYLCQELGFGHALKVDKLPVSFNGTWMAMRRENLTDSSLWTERVSFIESCTSTLAAAVECQKFACGEYTGLLHRRKKRDILSSSSSSQWPFIGYTSTFRSNRGCLSEILTPIWLITSAECLLSISKEPFNGSDWYVRTNIGQKTETDLAQNHEVLRIISHPHSSKFRSLILRDYDVALIRLKHALVFVSDKIGAICPPEEQVPPGITCFSGVLGTEKPRAPPPSILSINSLALQINDRKNCNTFDHYNGSVNQRMLCTQSSEGHTICDNDEGTPLMCLTGINKWFLAGMLTYQRYCEVYSKHPAVFSNLFAMRKFIDQVTGQKQYEIPYDSNVYVIIPPTTPSPTIPETTTAVYTTTEALTTAEFTESTTLNYTTEYTTISEVFNDTELSTISPDTTLNAEGFNYSFTHTATENFPTTTPTTIVEEIRNESNTTLENTTHELKYTTQSDDNYTRLTYPELGFTYEVASMENVTTIAPYIYEGRENVTTTIMDNAEITTLSDHFGLNDTNDSETDLTDLENATSPYSVKNLHTMFTTTAAKPEIITENIFDNKTETTLFPELTTDKQSPTSQEPIKSEFITESTVANFTESPLSKVIKLPSLNKTILTENITTILPILLKDHITTVSGFDFTNEESTTVESTKNPYLVEEFSTTDMSSDMLTTEDNETFIFEISGKPTEDLAFDVFTGKDGMRVESPGHLDNMEKSSSFKESSSRSRNLNEPHNISDILYDLTTKSTTEVPFLTTTLKDIQESTTKAMPIETTKLFESQGTTQASTKTENVEGLEERTEIVTDRTTITPGQTESKNMELLKTTLYLNKIREAETIIPDIETQPIMPRKLIENFSETTLPSNFPMTLDKTEPVTKFTTNSPYFDKQITPDIKTQPIMPRKLIEDFHGTTLSPNFPTTLGKTELVTAFTTDSPFYEKQGTGKVLEPVTERITVSDLDTTFNTETHPMMEDTTIISEYLTTKEPTTTETISHDANTPIMHEETRNTNDYITTEVMMQTSDINKNYSASEKQAEVTTVIPITTTVMKDPGSHLETTNKSTTISSYTITADEMKHYYEKQPVFTKQKVSETITDFIGTSEPFNFSKSLSTTSPTVSDLKKFQETTLTHPDFITTTHEIDTRIKTAEDGLTMSEKMTRKESTVTPEVFKMIEETTTTGTTNGLKHNIQSLTTNVQPAAVTATIETHTNSPLYSNLKTTKVSSSSPYQTTPIYPFLNESFENQTSVTEFAEEITPYLTTFPDIEYDRNIPIINDASKLLHLSSEKVLISGTDNETDKCGQWNHFSNKTDFNTLKFYEEWPALGYLQMVSEPKMCAAAIMSSHFVITSLSCLSYRDQQLNPEKWAYISGLNNSFVKGTQTHLVSEIISHTDMGISLMFHKHNLALVKLKDSIEMTEFSKHVCLPNDTDLLQQCFTTGWSKPTSGVDQEKMFYSVPVDIISQEECNSTANYNGLLLDTLICASHENKSSPTCKMDFGSPLFCLNENHWKLQGILDFSGPCDIAQPAVYNSISSVSNWILSFIQDDIL